jgi:hypothetical protein
MRHHWILGVVLLHLGCQPLLAQREPSPAPTDAPRQAVALRATLQRLLAPARIIVGADAEPGRDARAQEVRFSWDTVPGLEKAGLTAGGLRAVSRTRDAGAFPRLRALELADDKLFVAAVDADGGLRGWTVIQDPRFVRSEAPGSDGVLTGKTVALAHADFLVAIPDDPAIAEVKLFQPKRVRDDWELTLIVTLVMPPGGGAVR